MKKVFFAVLAICMVASMSFAAKQEALKAEGPDLICVDETFGPVYSLNKYVVDAKIISHNAVEGPPGDTQIPFVCQDGWCVGTLNAFATNWDGENLQFPRSSSSVLGGAEPVQTTLIAFQMKIPSIGTTFFGLDVLFYQCATTVTDQTIPMAGTYLPIYLIDDVFGNPGAPGSITMGLTISPDLGVVLRGNHNQNLGPWDWLVVCDLDPNDYDNDGYYEAALGFRTSPPGLSPISEWGSRAMDGEIGCAILTHILLNPPPGEGKLLGAQFDVQDPHPFWPPAGRQHVETLEGESDFTRPWCLTVFSDGQ